MKIIKLTKGLEAKVSDEDYDMLMQWKWYVRPAYRRNTKEIINYYTSGSKKIDGKWKSVSMHRLIMGEPKGMMVDHKDGFGLHNERDNLRICTRGQNSMNSVSAKGSSSRYIGVSYHKLQKSWISSICINKKDKFLGYFKVEKEAAIIYNLTARRYHGEFARPNKFN